MNIILKITTLFFMKTTYISMNYLVEEDLIQKLI